MVTRKAIKKAAGLTRDAAIEALYKMCLDAEAEGKGELALAVRKELNKLLGFYQAPPPTAEEADKESETLAAIRAHLEPLELGPPETPVDELVRLAVIRITNIDHSAGTPAEQTIKEVAPELI